MTIYTHMNQTTWIVGGGALVLAFAVGLYLFTGNAENGKVRALAKNSQTQPTVENKTQTPVPPETKATITTSMGDITVQLYNTEAPKTVANFAKLAKEGFYEGIMFHRVIKDFMIQGGDPFTKDDAKQKDWGKGGPGYQFEDELDPNAPSYKKGYVRGTLAMANSGPNTNGSQFFIVHKDYPLPHNYTIFGQVTSGIEVVDKIAETKTGEGDRPIMSVAITRVTVE